MSFKKADKKMILYITGSFPRLGDGIGDAAGKLYAAMRNIRDIHLVTSDIPAIREFVEEQQYSEYTLVSNWKYSTVRQLIKFAKNNHISKVIIEYCGNGYRKDLAISFMPWMIRLHNLFSADKMECHLRLHEYTMCRLPRKLFTMPLVWFCHHLDTPSFVEYECLRKKYGKKVTKSGIGSNINWREREKEPRHHLTGEKIRLAFFGGIYPGKGIETLIELWSDLEKRYPGEYEYQLLGGFPPNLTSAFDSYQKTVEKMIEEKGLKDKIAISGFLPEVEIEERLDGTDIAVLPYEDGLTLRRGSFLAFLGRNVAVVTSSGDEEAKKLFGNAEGVKMCANQEEMIKAIRNYSENGNYLEAGRSNAKYRSSFDWSKIADSVLKCF